MQLPLFGHKKKEVEKRRKQLPYTHRQLEKSKLSNGSTVFHLFACERMCVSILLSTACVNWRLEGAKKNSLTLTSFTCLTSLSLLSVLRRVIEQMCPCCKNNPALDRKEPSVSVAFSLSLPPIFFFFF